MANEPSNGNGKVGMLLKIVNNPAAVISLIAVGFAYWITQEVNSAQQRIIDAGIRLQTQQTEMLSKLEQVLDFQQRAGEEMLFYSFQNCVILARVAKVDSEQFCIKRPGTPR